MPDRSFPNHFRRLMPALLGLLLLALVSGCATMRQNAGRPYDPTADAFAFANELEWAYTFNEQTGKMEHQPRPTPPAFAQRCFPVVISARKFFYHARFDPAAPRVKPSEYQALARRILKRSQRRPSADENKIIVPGYDNLREFSREHEAMLKGEIGGKWQSYVQRGNWRMVFPFTRAGQNRMAARLKKRVNAGQAPIIHIVTFPSLAINHVILLSAVETGPERWRFAAYDPNTPGQPAEIFYDPAARAFYFPRNDYFHGGPVNIYEVYRNVCY